MDYTEYVYKIKLSIDWNATPRINKEITKFEVLKTTANQLKINAIQSSFGRLDHTSQISFSRLGYNVPTTSKGCVKLTIWKKERYYSEEQEQELLTTTIADMMTSLLSSVEYQQSKINESIELLQTTKDDPDELVSVVNQLYD